MSVVQPTSREIDGKGRSVRQLLDGQKYSIDYYQREYKWQTKHVSELMEDLAAKFLDSYAEGQERSAVAGYGHYFLGSIIISNKNGHRVIIDGQQRLTTLTLLLIFLRHQLTDEDQRHQLAELIFAQKFGQRSFNSTSPSAVPAWRPFTPAATSSIPSRRSPSPRFSPATQISPSTSRRSSAGLRCPISQIGSSRTSTSSKSPRSRTVTPTRSSRP